MTYVGTRGSSVRHVPHRDDRHRVTLCWRTWFLELVDPDLPVCFDCKRKVALCGECCGFGCGECCGTGLRPPEVEHVGS